MKLGIVTAALPKFASRMDASVPCGRLQPAPAGIAGGLGRLS